MSHASVRRLVMAVLRTDTDLDAFCLDYFPAVHREFTNGMKRTAKINLLLEMQSNDLGHLANLLAARDASGAEAQPEEAVVHAVVPHCPTRVPIRGQKFRIWISTASVIAILFVGTAYWAKRRQTLSGHASKLSPSPSLVQWWITTDPAGATVLLMPQRQSLGKTPLTLERTAAEGILCIRFERPGYWSRENAFPTEQASSVTIIEKLVPITDDTIPPELETGISPCAKYRETGGR